MRLLKLNPRWSRPIKERKLTKFVVKTLSFKSRLIGLVVKEPPPKACLKVKKKRLKMLKGKIILMLGKKSRCKSSLKKFRSKMRPFRMNKRR